MPATDGDLFYLQVFLALVGMPAIGLLVLGIWETHRRNRITQTRPCEARPRCWRRARRTAFYLHDLHWRWVCPKHETADRAHGHIRPESAPHPRIEAF